METSAGGRVIGRGRDVVRCQGARISFERRLVSHAWLCAAAIVGVALVVLAAALGARALGGLFGMLASIAVVVWFHGTRDPLRLGATRPILAIDLRLGVALDERLQPCARLDEVEIVPIDGDIDGLELRWPDGRVRVLEGPCTDGRLPTVVAELRALGLPIAAPPADPYRCRHAPTSSTP